MTTALIRRNALTDSCHNLTALMPRCTKISFLLTPHYICAHRNSDNLHNAAFIWYSLVGLWRTSTLLWSYINPLNQGIPSYTRSTYSTKYALYEVRTLRSTHSTKYALYEVRTLRSTHSTKYALYEVRTLRSTHSTKYALYEVRTLRSTHSTKYALYDIYKLVKRTSSRPLTRHKKQVLSAQAPQQPRKLKRTVMLPSPMRRWARRWTSGAVGVVWSSGSDPRADAVSRCIHTPRARSDSPHTYRQTTHL